MNEQLKIIISAEVGKLKQGVQEAKSEIGKFKEQVQQASKNVDDNFKKAGEGIKKGAKTIGVSIAAAGTALLALGASTKDYRAEQAKLTSAFDKAGASADTAKQVYNDLIGECSTRTGYKTSTIYLNGQLSTGVGGGICQVSTTLYNAVLRANLEIVQRRNHSLGVTYVPAGQDAMVNIGTSDFKFKNNREYPVKVVAFVGPGSVTCQIQGLKQPTEYEVKLESRTIEF